MVGWKRAKTLLWLLSATLTVSVPLDTSHEGSYEADLDLPGPFKVATTSYVVADMDSTDQTVIVVYPSIAGRVHAGITVASERFPLVSFAHGFAGGGTWEFDAYYVVLRGLASFGYFVVAPRACNYGCHDDVEDLPWDPRGFGHYYKQQLKAMAWARRMALSSDPIFSLLDLTSSAGIIGHSMGGQATAFSASGMNASQFNIAAAVELNPFTHQFPPSSVPFLVVTGSVDVVAPSWMSQKLFNAQEANDTRAFAEVVGKGHTFPLYSTQLPKYCAAWFKLHIDGKTSEHGVDYEGMIFGNSSISLCGGGLGEMKECTTLRRKS